MLGRAHARLRACVQVRVCESVRECVRFGVGGGKEEIMPCNPVTIVVQTDMSSGSNSRLCLSKLVVVTAGYV